MTHNERLNKLESLGWHQPSKPLQHRIPGDGIVWFISGRIDGVEYDAWIGERSGFVYLQVAEERMAAADRDQDFDRFCTAVANGWPEKKVAPAGRSLFVEDD